MESSTSLRLSKDVLISLYLILSCDARAISFVLNNFDLEVEFVAVISATGHES